MRGDSCCERLRGEIMKCQLSRKLTVAEKAAMQREIDEQIAANIRKLAKEITAMMLCCEHVAHGHGKVKLRRSFETFQPLMRELQRRYEMHESEDQAWLCERELNKIGVDLDEWCRESDMMETSV